MIINMKQSLIAAIGLLLSSSLFAKDYLISPSKTSLLITANAGEPSKMQYYGVSIAPGQIQSIYDAGLALNANSFRSPDGRGESDCYYSTGWQYVT